MPKQMSGENFVYQIGNSLYLNITNRCTNQCVFCIRRSREGVGYNLWLSREPGLHELVQKIGNPTRYGEIVFCGYGEPLLRPELVGEVARVLKSRGGQVRINTNGQVRLWYNGDLAGGLLGHVDCVNISLNAHSAEEYIRICRPVYKEKAYPAMLAFIEECTEIVPRVVLSVVKWPGVDLGECQRIADRFGVELKIRNYIC
ncbi:MAG: TatD family nuclease-associated radical SAM protein [Desulfurispora sp.]|uniref:TatD family nuclease-associated radical SAM protein n=1 Tax=Desulfurispora sp. TaxID=3014275 RepID=UPI00404B6D96